MNKNDKLITINKYNKLLEEHKQQVKALHKEFRQKLDDEQLNQFFKDELQDIPCLQIKVSEKRNTEDIAEDYYKKQGYDVYRSRINHGYRSIGVEYYWRQYASKITDEDRQMIEKLKACLPKEKFYELAYMVQNKKGCPDLLLHKNNKISFVEVKYNDEAVKFPTIEFYIKYGVKWDISILRVYKNANND